MASSITSVKAMAVLGFTVTLFLQGCSSLGWGGYQGESYQITPPLDPSVGPAAWGNDSSATYHTVQRGETLSIIAQRYGRDWRDVARWNNLSTPYTLNVGQQLLIAGATTSPVYQPRTIASSPIYTSPAASSNFSTSVPAAGTGQYQVQPGDTVYRLSRQSGYSVSQLMSWNGLSSPQLLRVGQRFWLTPPSGNTLQSTNFRAQSVTQPVSRPITPNANSSNYHVVVGGDTLYSVARRYGYTPEDIAAWNGLTPPYTLTIGSSLRLGSTGTAPMRSFSSASSNVSSVGNRYHVVSRGQTAYSIANMYGCSVNELLVNNGLNSTRLRVRQKLNVSKCSGSSGYVSSPNSLAMQSLSSTQNVSYHTVKSGETLDSIARLYGVTIHELAFWNGIGSPYTVYPGKHLTINSR
jgi:peptidoglycan DL-endopeptidase LytF